MESRRDAVNLKRKQLSRIMNKINIINKMKKATRREC